MSFQENVVTFATETTVVNGMKTIEFYDYTGSYHISTNPTTGDMYNGMKTIEFYDYTGSYHISTNPTTGDMYKKDVSGRRLKF